MALLFQSNPDRWDLRKSLVPGRHESWLVNRYRALMRPGRLVLLWEAKGSEPAEVRGLYGWGIITDELTRGTEDRIRLQYIERWVSMADANQPNREDDIAPIPAYQVLSLRTWEKHLLNIIAAGTNFVVNTEQLEELSEYIVNVRFPKSMFGQAVQQYVSEETLDPKAFSPNIIFE